MDSLRDVLENSDEALAYFYCYRNQDDLQDPTSILRSFVRQLSTSPKGDVVQRLATEVYKKHEQHGFRSGDLAFEESADIIRKYINIYPQTTLVLDALDESDPKTRRELVEFFEDLVLTSSNPVKIFIASRPDDDIRSRFQSRANVEIQASHNHQDIAKFVKERVQKDARWGSNIPKDLREKLVQVLLEKSNGM